jgi:hypothetical protein
MRWAQLEVACLLVAIIDADDREWGHKPIKRRQRAILIRIGEARSSIKAIKKICEGHTRCSL